MKKNLLSLALLSLAALTSRGDVIFTESFNYPDGPIVATGTNIDGSTNWFRHSGSASPSDALVKSLHLENTASTGPTPRQDDVNRPLCNGSCTYTSSLQVLYASFTVNCT